MTTQVLRPDKDALQKAAAILSQGGLVAFPTETVYGLGANALDENAVRAIFAAKERPCDNPLIVHVTGKRDLAPLCVVSARAEALMDAFWPGPLTVLLPKKPLVPDVTTANLPSVAVRCPGHSVALALISALGAPIAAPSANRSGRPSPTTAAHVLEDMNGRIPLILDGGACSVGVESTVVDMTGDEPIVLRPGGVTPEMIAGVLGSARVADSVMRPLREGEIAPSPGMRHRHYAPRGSMTLVRGEARAVEAYIKNAYDACGESACILCLSAHAPAYENRRVMLLGDTDGEVAARLFAVLRDMDDMGVRRIFAEAIPQEGIGLAVMNRMARASAFDVVSLQDS